MNINNPLVSVLIPCYNHEKYVDDCIESIINQTYDNIEVLIIDDRSLDNSYQMLMKWKDKLKERFANVLISRNSNNLGVVKTLNKMILMSKGEYIKIIASDDMLTNDCIEKMVIYSQSNKALLYFTNAITIDADFKYSDYINIDDIKKIETIVYKKKPLDGANVTKNLLEDCYIFAPTMFIPKSTYNNFGLYDKKYIMEDFEYLLRVSSKGCIKYVDEITALYRKNDDSLSRNRTQKYNDRFIRFVLDKKEIFDNYSNCLDKKTIVNYYNTKILGQLSDSYDKEHFIALIKEMKEKKIDITFINEFKLVLFKMGLHSLYKKITRCFND